MFVKNKNVSLETSPIMDLSYWPKSCAEGFVSHIAVIDRGCQIAYCTETNKFSLGPLPQLIKPPFIQVILICLIASLIVLMI